MTEPFIKKPFIFWPVLTLESWVKVQNRRFFNKSLIYNDLPVFMIPAGRFNVIFSVRARYLDDRSASFVDFAELTADEADALIVCPDARLGHRVEDGLDSVVDVAAATLRIDHDLDAIIFPRLWDALVSTVDRGELVKEPRLV